MFLKHDFDSLWIWKSDLEFWIWFWDDFGYEFDMESRRFGYDFHMVLIWFRNGMTLWGSPWVGMKNWNRNTPGQVFGRLLRCFLISIRCVYDVYMILMFSEHIQTNNIHCKKQKPQFWATSKPRFWPMSETCWSRIKIKIMTAKTVSWTISKRYIYIYRERERDLFSKPSLLEPASLQTYQTSHIWLQAFVESLAPT